MDPDIQKLIRSSNKLYNLKAHGGVDNPFAVEERNEPVNKLQSMLNRINQAKQSDNPEHELGRIAINSLSSNILNKLSGQLGEGEFVEQANGEDSAPMNKESEAGLPSALDTAQYFKLFQDKKNEVIHHCELMQKDLSLDSHDLDVKLAINALKTKDFEQLSEHIQDLEWADRKELYYLMAFK